MKDDGSLELGDCRVGMVVIWHGNLGDFTGDAGRAARITAVGVTNGASGTRRDCIEVEWIDPYTKEEFKDHENGFARFLYKRGKEKTHTRAGPGWFRPATEVELLVRVLNEEIKE